MLKGEITDISSLTSDDRERMYQIMLRHYAEVHWDSFLSDMAEKDGTLVFRDEQDEIQGFSTFLFMRTAYQGVNLVALFSGDTIIDRSHWGTPALFNTFGRLLHRLMIENPDLKTYWFLITKGYRTYLMLSLFFREFYPRPGVETPPFENGLIEHLAGSKYNGQYDRGRGVIMADSYFLKGEFAEIPEVKLRNENVKFFLEKNPRYAVGEELACVCAIHPENFRRRTHMLVRP